MASMEATSLGLASGISKTLGCCSRILSELNGLRFLRGFQHLHRGIVAWNPAHSLATKRARPAKVHILVIGFDAPGPDLFFALSKRKRRRVLKNVTLEHPERVFDINGAFAFDAEAAVTRHSQAILQRLVQPLINALDEFFLRMLSHGPVIAHEQIPRRIQSEQRHGMETFFSQLGRKNAEIGIA